MDGVASALADPIRRQILQLLRESPLSAGAIAVAIADAFAVSRPAVSRHLRVLREAGLVRDEAAGRERVYRFDAAPLADLAAFVTLLRSPCDVRAEWERRFSALETEVHRTRKKKRASQVAKLEPPRRKSA